MHVRFNMLGHVMGRDGEEYKLTGFGYTLIFFTVLLWSLKLLPFGLPALLSVYFCNYQQHMYEAANNYNCYQLHLY